MVVKNLSFKLPAPVRDFSEKPVPFQPVMQPEEQPAPVMVEEEQVPETPSAGEASEVGEEEALLPDENTPEDGRDEAPEDVHIIETPQEQAHIAGQLDRLEDTIEMLKKAIAGFAELRESFQRDFEVSAVKLVYEIATKVIHKELATSPDIILYQIQETLKNIADEVEVRIRCHPADCDFISTQTSFLEWLQNNHPACRLVPDEKIGRGGCIVETAGEVRDATIESQLAEIRKHLATTVEEHA